MEVTTITDPHLEALAIGAALTDPEVAAELCDVVTPEDFTDSRNATVWRAVAATVAAGQCDLLTVSVACPDVSRSDLAGLMAACPSPELGRAAVDQLKILRDRRELFAIGARISQSASDLTQEPADIAAEAVSCLTAATRIRAGAVTLAEALPEAMEYLARLRDGDASVAGLLTGFPALDRYLQLRPGELTVVGARPSVGKSAFLLTVALNVAQTGAGVLLVSCEMSARELTLRALAGLSGVAVADVQHGAVSAAVWARVEAARDDLARLPLRIADRGRCRVSDVVREAKAMQRAGGLALVCVDYLGLLTAVRTARSRTKENEVAEVSQDLKAAAMQLRLPFLVACQLNRDAEAHDKPTLRHLRDSGAIEQDSDNVLLLHRDRDSDRASVLLAKQRNGENGLEIPLVFNGALVRFESARTNDDGGI